MNKEFLLKTFLSNTQSSSFQRGRKVYSEHATPQDRKRFQKHFRARLRALEQRYSQRVSEDEHIQTIQDFANQLSESHQGILANGRLRIGTAQKAINLFLKFLWCLDLIPEPPHCPIDRIILREIGDTRNWTEIDSIEEYRSIITAIRQRAGQQTCSQWEYGLWNRNAQG